MINNRICEYLMLRLAAIGVPTHFVRRLNMREQLINEVEIIPLEVVVRNVAAGSLATALRHRRGPAAAALDHRVLLQERRARRPDGLRGAHHRLRLGRDPGPRRHDGDGLRVNDFLSGLFAGVGIRLIDFKLEFGRL